MVRFLFSNQGSVLLTYVISYSYNQALSRGIYQNIADLVTAARMAGIEGEDDISLLESAKLVSEAVGGILRTAKELSEVIIFPEFSTE